MFKIIYNLSNDSIPSNNAEINDENLRYCFFLGEITLITEKSSIFLNWDWIPILDFAICLMKICDDLQKVELGKMEFEFTESEEKIIFEKNAETVTISTTFSNENLELNFRGFSKSVESFFNSVATDVSNKDLGAKNNEILSEFFKKANGHSN